MDLLESETSVGFVYEALTYAAKFLEICEFLHHFSLSYYGLLIRDILSFFVFSSFSYFFFIV